MDNTKQDENDDTPPPGWHRHVNPDGSLGGWIPDSAEIDPGAYVGSSAFVDPNSKLAAGGRVLDGQLLTASGEIIDLGRNS